MGETTVLYGGPDLHGDNVFCTLMDAPLHTGGFLAPPLRIRGVGPRAQARGPEPDERLDGTVSAGRKPADETTADSEYAFVPDPTVNGVKT
ncbi:MAG TPA: hypothetical protein P5026_00270 [Kiritimatiellia bacterium]|nr:hypothetical protein [Kiritimatiellia bacterium]HRU69528.1 hypothetical protein [Kiritimatiellia bacterium]